MNYSTLKSNNIAVFVAWPYANAPTLHIGHLVGAILPSDIFARFNRMLERNVLHVTGTDMHGTPVSIKAQKNNLEPKDFALNNHKQFVKQLKQLNIDFDLYTNTHNNLHEKVTNNIGKLLYERGFLFPKTTKMFYDKVKQVFLPDRYVEGICPYCGYSPARGDQCDNCGRILDPLELINPISKLSKTKPVIKNVTNLYLDLPKLKKELENWLKQRNNFRKHVKEMTLGFIKEGLKPRPVTRNIDWGIKVKINGFEDQVWYVWFEAVIGYLSASIAWDIQKLPTNIPIIFNKRTNLSWEDFWKNKNTKHYYFLGKDNIPFHTIIWPIQLLMYNKKYKDKKLFKKYILPNEKTNSPLNLAYDVPANNFLNMNSAKISKSTGNYIGLNDLLTQYDVSHIRFVFARLMPENKDTDFTMQKFQTIVNNELVATIGNLIYRVFSFAEKTYHTVPEANLSQKTLNRIKETFIQTQNFIEKVQLSKALEEILKLAQYGNKLFNNASPWKAYNTTKSKQAVFDTLNIAYNLAILLFPYTPNLSYKIFNYLDTNILNNSKYKNYPTWNFYLIKPNTKINDIKIPVAKIK